MTVCPKCKFYNICGGRLNETVENCVRFKSVEQTNEEWLRQASTEQLAEFLGNIAKNAYQCGQNGKTNKCVNRNHCTGYCDYGWEVWLKQPHGGDGE